MNANREKLYGYSYLFALTLVFSALATESTLMYSLIRGSSAFSYEPLIVGIVLCTLFSALGQMLSKTKEIGRWIFFVSAVSSIVSYDIFVSWRVMDGFLYFSSAVTSFMFGWFAYWEFLPYSWIYISKRRISKKHIVIIVTLGIPSILVTYYVFLYSPIVVSFFDSHPWAMTLVGILITSIVSTLGGLLIGRRTKKS